MTLQKMYQLTFFGEGNCDNLENSYAGQISAKNIKFYCAKQQYVGNCPIGEGPPPVPPGGF